MDSTKDENTSASQDVFSQPETAPPDPAGVYNPPADVYGNFNPESVDNSGYAGDGSVPPPYDEDNKKKFIIPIIIFLVLVILVFFVIKLLNRPKTSKNISLSYWGLWEDNAIFRPIIDDYVKLHPTVKINYQKQTPKEYRERLQAALARGDGPDIFRFHNTWLPMFKEDLAPVPQNIMTTSEYEKTFYPVTKNDLKLGDSYFGIPLELDGLVLLYNDDILKASGVSPPSNWEDVRTAAMKLTVKDKTTNRIVTGGIALGTANNIEHFSDILGLMMLQNGADLKDPTKPEAVEALTFYRKFAEPPNNTWDDTLENSIVAFAGGKLAMVFVPTWEILNIREMNPSLNFKVMAVPQLPGVNINWASYWVEGVSRRSTNQTEAFNFLKYLSTKEVMVKLYTEQAKQRQLFGEPYSRVDLSETVSSDPYLGPLMQEANSMRSFPLASRTYDNGINDQLIKYLLDGVNSLSAGASPQSAMETANKGFIQILTKYGLLNPPTPTQ
ncbi:MAG: extracellular solute-binding protein family 1 [Candidatus Gottesmanbacteria bacterium GW2011_GWA2_41_12]|uniref:Extracellular solute-binding protein family 1 n=1 Tax=Candidatus Gottesmanbacteria bacterium GW2011_GWA2_41_12 TaxID=1618440 RepID=A0A0G0UHS5_9BACT|nr:MAG: extracellular solute-binding protein family 1 [Candidatus Gottesmanbacteria bacterium GW2011_GWA2_41_12]